MGCAGSLLLLAAGVMTLVTMLRWFEQVTIAVDEARWTRLALLVVVPPAAWAYPSRVQASRPTAVPLHTPVRGFGSVPKAKPVDSPRPDGPPPGTPPEFIGLPQVPTAKLAKKPAVDPDKLEKMRQKMREQGLLPPDPPQE